ncbi:MULTISPECIES: DMT family transporter [Reinekea]|uniref:Permease of the drug/metabolite transporter (DMT) superfamily n=2 Tax=Reinekea forsetii TaxID=1336806 RepID=A0A2K8KK57_9GAMM|nr:MULTISPECIES: DMT family transporter [Reinekea]ATX75385.1 permease of the drug/metabolite transporter (DMT) superfamily [Reinekea forsetii]
MRHSVLLAALLGATSSLFWAGNAIVGKVVVATLPAFTLSQFRWALAFVLLAPFGLPRIYRQWHWYRQHLPRLSLLALLSVGFYNTLQYWALEYTEPVKVGAMLALMPLSIAVVSGFLGGRKLSGLEWLTSIVAVFGAVVVVSNGQWSVFFSQQRGWLGELLMVCAVSSWAFYSVLLKRLPHAGIEPIGLLTFFVGVGCVLILPFWLYDVRHEAIFVPPPELWWSIAFVAIFPSILSFMCWNKAVSLADPTIAGLMVTTAPLFNAMLSMAFLNAHISLTQWSGIAIVIVGVASTLLLSRRQTVVPVPAPV